MWWCSQLKPELGVPTPTQTAVPPLKIAIPVVFQIITIILNSILNNNIVLYNNVLTFLLDQKCKQIILIIFCSWFFLFSPFLPEHNRWIQGNSGIYLGLVWAVGGQVTTADLVWKGSDRSTHMSLEKDWSCKFWLPEMKKSESQLLNIIFSQDTLQFCHTVTQSCSFHLQRSLRSIPGVVV